MFKNNPKQIFLLDALGALLSAFLLGVVLVKLETVFGIPRSTLYFLAFLPCLFAIYDVLCYFLLKKTIGPYLKGIAYVNLLYCFISLGLAFYHYQEITYFGWTYILLEIVIILVIANFEFKTASKMELNKL